MFAAPAVKPAAPVFGAHHGTVGPQLTQTAELLQHVGAGAEVHGPQQVGEGVLLEVGGPVALEEQRLVEAHLAKDVADRGDVRLVLAVGAVFVLYLHHDDGAALVGSEGCELFAHLLLKELHALHEVWVFLAQLDVALLQQPPRQATHLPFSADVGSGAHDDLHAMLLAETHKGCDVVLAGEVEDTLLLFVDVPEDIHTDGIHAQCLAHLDAVLPVGTRDAGIVQLGGADAFGYRQLLGVELGKATDGLALRR